MLVPSARHPPSFGIPPEKASFGIPSHFSLLEAKTPVQEDEPLPSGVTLVGFENLDACEEVLHKDPGTF